jgi:hypothetical protein
MPTNTCPHCGTVCGSPIADEGHVLQSKECQRRELALLVNRVEQLAEQLAEKDAAAVEASKLFLRSLKAASAERDAAAAELARLREGVAAWVSKMWKHRRSGYICDHASGTKHYFRFLESDLDALAAMAAGSAK